MRKHIILFCCFIVFSKGYAKPDTVQSHSGPDITNGRDAEPMEFPYLVSLQYNQQHFCGGSILNKNYILTAAHCIERIRYRPELIQVVTGTNKVNEPYETRVVENIIVHEQYRLFIGRPYDISLLKLKTPLEFNSRVQPTILPEAHSPIPVGSAVVVSGWGQALGEQGEKSPTILKTTKIYVADQDNCVKMYAERSGNVTENNFCANDPSVRTGACHGDSGGPVTLNGTQVGIVSWGRKDPTCSSTKYPAVYIRVPQFIDWIKKHAV